MSDGFPNNVDSRSPFCSLAPNWKMFVLRGVIALGIGVLAWLLPGEAVMALTLVFGAFSFVDGIFALWAGVTNLRAGERWGWLIASGLLGIATGVVVVLSPLVATLVMAVFLWSMVSFWAVVTGAAQIAAAIRLRKEIEGEWVLGLSGLISVLLGAAVLWFMLTAPEGGILALGWMLGLYAVLFGILMILLGLKLKQLRGAGR